MATRLCCHCSKERAVLRRPKTLEQLCKGCFYAAFEDEVHRTIVNDHLFMRGERVALGASGGKDSTVLMHLMKLLNERHNYGLNLFLLSIDEGIAGYRDDSLETVRTNEQHYGIPLEVVSYKQLYGWTMDEIVAQIGTRNNCTYCGVFRRQALDRGAVLLGANKIATGHNADDVAETVLLNILRGDAARLGRCASAITGEDSALPRVKPFKYTYEKEIVMYAYFKRLTYFSTECLYAPFAARGAARDFVKDLEAARPSAILDIIRSAESFCLQMPANDCVQQPRTCERCHYMSSQPLCKACLLLEGLNRGLPGYGVRRMRGGGKGIKQVVMVQGGPADIPSALHKTRLGGNGEVKQADGGSEAVSTPAVASAGVLNGLLWDAVLGGEHEPTNEFEALQNADSAAGQVRTSSATDKEKLPVTGRCADDKCREIGRCDEAEVAFGTASVDTLIQTNGDVAPRTHESSLKICRQRSAIQIRYDGDN